MSFPNEILPIQVEMYCNSADDPGMKWRDISSDVLWSQYIQISQGRPDALRDTPPSSCVFTLKNLHKNYARRNPTSPYYGYLGVGTPLRVRVGLERDDFSDTVVNGWGSADVGGAWTLDGTSADFDKAGGVGTVVIPAAANIRIAYLPAAVHADVDMQIDFSCSAASITGGSAVPAGLMVRGVSLTDFVYTRVEAKTDGTFTITIVNDDASAIGAGGTVAVPGCTYAQGRWYTLRFSAYGNLLMAKMWERTNPEPLEWTVVNADARQKYSGWVGLRTATTGSNTNANFTVSYDNFVVRANRFGGEIASIRPGRDTSGRFDYVDVEASGYLRRKSQGDEAVFSTLRRAIPTVGSLLAYWPLEEESNATQFSAATPNTAPLDIQSEATPNYAANREFLSSAPLPSFNGAAFGAVLPPYNATINGATMLRLVSKVPSTGDTNFAVLARIWGTGSAGLWQLTYSTPGGGSINLEVFDTAVSTLLLSTTVATGVNGLLLRWSLEMDQNGGSVDWEVNTNEVGLTTVGSATGSLAGTIGQATYVDFNPLDTSLTGTVIGHISVQTNLTPFGDVTEQFNAYNGERAGARIDRICDENNVRSLGVDAGGYGALTAPVGPQRVMALVPLLRECANTDQGTLFDARGWDVPALQYRPAFSTYNQSAMVTLDLSAGQVAPAWEPRDDDQQMFNSVVANSVGGGKFTAELTSGALSTAEVEAGGIGKRDTQYNVNTWRDSQLPDIAYAQLALGTVDEYRHPVLKVNLGSPAVIAAGLMNRVLDVGVDDRIVVTNASSAMIYDPISQIARGYREWLRQTDYAIDFNCTPESPYQIVELDDSDSLGYLDAESTVLYSAVNSTATSLTVWSRREPWTTTVPYPLMVAGERMQVTACTSHTAPALIPATAAVHANNASVTPTVPATAAVGNLLLIPAAIRNSGTGTPDLPAGWTLLADASNLRLFGKIAEAADLLAAPTITFTGGAANATTTAQMAAVSNVLPLVYDRNTQLNASAQNIAIVPPLTPPCAPSCVVMIGWKQDDWTSVATLNGMTEVGDSSSTIGDDQGLVWDVQFCNGFTSGANPGTAFTVTGGAAAISRSIAIVLPVSQTMTVTRSTNGVAKSHPANTPIHVAEPARLGLIGT